MINFVLCGCVNSRYLVRYSQITQQHLRWENLLCYILKFSYSVVKMCLNNVVKFSLVLHIHITPDIEDFPNNIEDFQKQIRL